MKWNNYISVKDASRFTKEHLSKIKEWIKKEYFEVIRTPDGKIFININSFVKFLKKMKQEIPEELMIKVKSKVLILHTDIDFLHQLKDYFSSEPEYEVTISNNGREFLYLVGKLQPDIVIMHDCSYQHNSIDAYKLLKNKGIKNVIVMTAHDEDNPLVLNLRILGVKNIFIMLKNNISDLKKMVDSYSITYSHFCFDYHHSFSELLKLAEVVLGREEYIEIADTSQNPTYTQEMCRVHNINDGNIKKCIHALARIKKYYTTDYLSIPQVKSYLEKKNKIVKFEK